MFFAHVALRPAVQQLPPPQRLALLAATMGTFFRWVGAAVAVILASGFMMIFASGGFTAFGGYVHVMTALGLVMTTIYGYIVAVPYSAPAGRGRCPAVGAGGRGRGGRAAAGGREPDPRPCDDHGRGPRPGVVSLRSARPIHWIVG